jgi:hypothetical protein
VPLFKPEPNVVISTTVGKRMHRSGQSLNHVPSPQSTVTLPFVVKLGSAKELDPSTRQRQKSSLTSARALI